jgi:hypothetical protein
VNDTAGNSAVRVSRTVNVIAPGELLVTVDFEDPENIAIGFSGGEAVLDPATPSMTVIAAATGATNFIWYLDGMQTGGDNATILIESSALTPGLHEIDLVVFVSGGEQYSSGFSFLVEN